ncbi:MAG: hypothetical protein ACLFVO_13460 [Chloroflexaceae bacterium]
MDRRLAYVPAKWQLLSEKRGQGPPLLNNPDNPDAPPEEGPAEGDSE